MEKALTVILSFLLGLIITMSVMLEPRRSKVTDRIIITGLILIAVLAVCIAVMKAIA